jgi:hypothetical protein
VDDTQYDPPTARPLATASENERVPATKRAMEIGAYYRERLRHAAEYHESAAGHSANGWHADMAVTMRDIAALLGEAEPHIARDVFKKGWP